MAGSITRTPPEPPRKERLGDKVYGRLLKEIISGRFSEADKLPTETALAEMFEVSRPVLREALLRLQTDGIIRARQGSGTYIERRPPARFVDVALPINVSRIVRLFEFRLTLEPPAARLAAERAERDEIKALEATFATMGRELGEGAIRSDTDFLFHRQVAIGSHNPFILRTLDDLRPDVVGQMDIALTLTAGSSRARGERVLEEHERILEAVASRDPESAAIAMAHHLDRARKRVTDRRRML